MRLREAAGFYAALLKGHHPVKRKLCSLRFGLLLPSGPTRTSAVKPAARSNRRQRPQKRPYPCKLVYRSRFALSKSEKARVKQLLADPTFHVTCGRERVTHADLVGLLPGMWVNDNIINFYAASVMASRRARESIFIFSTFIYHQLITAGYTNGRLGRWTKEIDIFAKDAVLIPININNVHWIIAALNFRLKRVEIYDSAHWDHSNVFLLSLFHKCPVARNENKLSTVLRGLSFVLSFLFIALGSGGTCFIIELSIARLPDRVPTPSPARGEYIAIICRPGRLKPVKSVSCPPAIV
ncbi:hypothetical protein B0H13DRAFT_1953396 [Mycena leptocephala]|nr:hypothetical protein B0H13DRAFT_1953396 [Mycena leptocephala]